MFGTAQPALLAFPEERPVFLREYSTNHYSVISYFLSRLTMEAFITALQILVQVTITYFLISLQAPFGILYLAVYALAMTRYVFLAMEEHVKQSSFSIGHSFSYMETHAFCCVSSFDLVLLLPFYWDARSKIPNLVKKCFLFCSSRKCYLLASLYYPT